MLTEHQAPLRPVPQTFSMIIKILSKTALKPLVFNFVREEMVEWKDSNLQLFYVEELKLPNDCCLSTEERHQRTTVCLAGTGAHTVVSSKNVVFKLLLFNEIKQTTEFELLQCLIARN